jgi:hypothetical protein
MWNNISNLWDNDKKPNTVNTSNYVNDLMKLMNNNSINNNSVIHTIKEEVKLGQSNFILTELSSRFPTPQECPIKLWPHQEAMISRIRKIEAAGYTCTTSSKSAIRFMDKSLVNQAPQVILGVMNDPPGSGKTYAILTQILIDTTPGASIIIVPQNIYGQWRQATETIFKNQANKCKFVSMYGDVLDIFGYPQSVNTFKVILLQDNFAEAYLKTLNDNKISVCRIVIDEIDIMDNYVQSAVPSKFVWLMSASYTDQKQLGPYNIGDHTKVICKCHPDFVKKSINLPDPITSKFSCDDNHITIFEDIVSDKEMKALKAGDLAIINRLMNATGQINLGNMKDIIGRYAEYLFKKSEQLEEVEKEVERCKHSFNETDKKELNILIDKMNMLRRFRKNSEILISKLRILPDITTLVTKDTYLEGEFVDKMLQDRSSKWLIFNDNGNVLIKYQGYLMGRGIKTVMLDGGNQKMIERTLKDYKEGDIQVLLLNSMIEGAGMNLENTTHLLFMHKTEEKFIEQVVGRAQRYGRKTPLNIFMLFNKNE